jgi:hypothetical protein
LDARTLLELPLDGPDTDEDLRGSADRDFARIECDAGVVSFLSGGGERTQIHVLPLEGEGGFSCAIPDDVAAGPIAVGSRLLAYSSRALYWLPKESERVLQQDFPEAFEPVIDPTLAATLGVPPGGLPYWDGLQGLAILGSFQDNPAVMRISFREEIPRFRPLLLLPDSVRDPASRVKRDVLVSPMPDGGFVVSMERQLRVFQRDLGETADQNSLIGPFGPAYHAPPLTASVAHNQVGRPEIRLVTGEHAGYVALSASEYEVGLSFYWVSGHLVFAFRTPNGFLRFVTLGVTS